MKGRAEPRCEVRLAIPADVAAMLAIYAKVVRETAISFEAEAPSPEEFARRLAERQASHCWIVGHDEEGVLAYAYGGPWRARAAYAWTTETTIYVHERARGRGIGKQVYGELLRRLTAQGFRAAIGGIALPNAASVALHEALGFRHVGTHAKCGHKFGRWHDVGFWEVELAPRPDEPTPALPRGAVS